MTHSVYDHQHELTTRAFNRLCRYGFKTLEEVAEGRCKCKIYDLKERNVGAKTIENILEVLDVNGVKLIPCVTAETLSEYRFRTAKGEKVCYYVSNDLQDPCWCGSDKTKYRCCYYTKLWEAHGYDD